LAHISEIPHFYGTINQEEIYLVGSDPDLTSAEEEIGTHMDGQVVNCKSAIANVFNSIGSSLNLTS
jgi:hypothetical protein